MVTQPSPQQLSAILAWYHEMGVSGAVGDHAINWCERGDVAPGAAFQLVAVHEAGVRSSGVSGPKNVGPVAPAPSQLRGDAAPREHSSPTPVRGIVARNSGTPAPGGGTRGINAKSLVELRTELAAFEGCGLKATAKSLCFYRGAEQARVMVIGEAPGRDEDLAGRPFAGQAGQLLDAMLGAIGLMEGDVHIANVVYWRPPGNRTPTVAEVSACAPFLTRQIELVKPEFVLILGGIAAKHLLETPDSIMKVRGKWRTILSAGREVKALATLHPAYVLKVPAAKRQVWRDLLSLKVTVAAQDAR